MASVVGKIDLTKMQSELERQIAQELKNSWLDRSTAHGFRKELEAKLTAKADVHALEALLRKVQREIRERKDRYGVREVFA